MTPFKSEDAKLIAKLGISYAAEDLLCIRDITGRILVVNKAWERMLDYSLEEIENRPLIQLVHPDDRDATRRTMMLVNDDHRASLF